MIPDQLKYCRFCRVKHKSKKPFEQVWTMLEEEHLRDDEGNWYNEKTGEYVYVTENKQRVKYDGPIHNYSKKEIEKFLPNENYGVLTGIEDWNVSGQSYRIGVLDDDTENKELLSIALEYFGPTFRVRDHLYFKIRHWDGQKIIFYNSNGEHCGELQGKGQMVIGPNSIHPSGEKYEIVDDVPLVMIELDTLKCFFKDYIPKKTITPKPKPTKLNYNKENYAENSNWDGDDVKDIPITNVISMGGLMDMGGGCYQGPHPVHNSTNGMNFRVDTNDNTWYCYRCRSGGSSPELIAVVEGIIDCSDAGKRCLEGDKGSQVINIAREKYGLKKPEININKKPMGWALSINIKKMAERFGLLYCCKCKIPYSFNEELGQFKCSGCGEFGGLKKFALLCYKNKLGVENGL